MILKFLPVFQCQYPNGCYFVTFEWKKIGLVEVGLKFLTILKQSLCEIKTPFSQRTCASVYFPLFNDDNIYHKNKLMKLELFCHYRKIKKQNKKKRFSLGIVELLFYAWLFCCLRFCSILRCICICLCAHANLYTQCIRSRLTSFYFFLNTI